MVIDELIVRKGTTNLPIDSYDDKMIDEIVYEGNSFHFAKQKDLVGETSVNADNAVSEPIISLGVEGNTFQKTYTGKNLIDVDKFAELILSYDTTSGAIVERDGRRCIRFMNNKVHGRNFTSCCPAFKANTRYILSCEVLPNAPTTSANSLFMGFKPSPLIQIQANETTEFTRIYSVSKADTTVTDIALSFGSSYVWLIDLDTVYLYEYEGDTNPTYEPYTGREPSPNVNYPQAIDNASNVSVKLNDIKLTIPSELTLADGTVVPLRFAKYRNADYLSINNKQVKYFSYSTEGDPTKPISEQVENVPPIEYDLTDTEVGQNLLALATEKGTNILTITSDLPVSQTNLSYWRQVIPNE